MILHPKGLGAYSVWEKKKCESHNREIPKTEGDNSKHVEEPSVRGERKKRGMYTWLREWRGKPKEGLSIATTGGLIKRKESGVD